MYSSREYSRVLSGTRTILPGIRNLPVSEPIASTPHRNLCCRKEGTRVVNVNSHFLPVELTTIVRPSSVLPTEKIIVLAPCTNIRKTRSPPSRETINHQYCCKKVYSISVDFSVSGFRLTLICHRAFTYRLEHDSDLYGKEKGEDSHKYAECSYHRAYAEV